MSHAVCCIPRDAHIALKRIALDRSQASGHRITLSDVLAEALIEFIAADKPAPVWIPCPPHTRRTK
jgi:hypothetical protein